MEWTPESGLVTAAFKIRRRNVYDKYRDDIGQMYSSWEERLSAAGATITAP